MDEASRVWASDMSTAYDECLVPAVFQPYADDLADRIAALAPATMLELAAGTGVLTQAVLSRRPSVRVTATDLNVAMVEVGSANVPAATWQQADAMQLPFDDASFDLVACQFGVMFLPDRAEAYAGIARVLVPRGRFLFNCWGPLSSHEVETTVIDTLAEIFPEDPPRFLARVPHGYHDADAVAADVAAGGLVDVRIENVALECRSPSAAVLARGYCRGTPLRPEIEARGDLDETARALEAALTERFGSGPVVGRMEALVVSAAAPSSLRTWM